MKFELTADQQKKLDDWVADIPPEYTGAIGGRFNFCFSPTSLGTVVVVKDTFKGREIDLTDYGDW